MSVVLLLLLLQAITFVMMVLVTVAAWRKGSSPGDFGFFVGPTRVVDAVLLGVLVSAGAFWASRVFHWKKAPQ